jgi:hypothetical protein
MYIPIDDGGLRFHKRYQLCLVTSPRILGWSRYWIEPSGSLRIQSELAIHGNVAERILYLRH